MFGENSYIDFHTHNLDGNFTDQISIHVVELGDPIPVDYYTVGKHPWKVKKGLTASELDLLQSHAEDRHCLAIGEIGMDKIHAETFLKQKEVFIQQLEVASAVNLPVVIHCVRAFDEVLQIKKKFPNISKWAIHGFNRNALFADQLIKAGFYLSMNPLKGQHTQQLLEGIPIERLFLETDNSENSISDVYIRTAELMKIDPLELKAKISRNANIFFGK